MTTTTSAIAFLLDDDATANQLLHLVGQEPITANAYVRDIGAIEGHAPWTWACGADLAQWGSFRRNEYVTREIAWTLRAHEDAVLRDRTGYLPIDRSAALAQRFDY